MIKGCLMSKTIFNKLVRDNIPEMITIIGKDPVCETLDDQKYIEMLEIKLQEEIDEYLTVKEPEELADMLEVIYALAEANGLSKEALEKLRSDKAEERGTFSKKILLVEINE